ncbi:type II toxin-antitoxin system RelE/ParE family toxin, partial [Escherichia coli]|uniref:type II toxin-antitoxin system RelE/ParE family toxin n=1 Tax=Escherichia coli TaxID=562 RepID=UPI0020CE35EA
TINVHVSTRQTCFKNRLIRCVGNFGGSGVEPLVIHPHFVLVYEVDSQWGKVYILRVLHTAQKWP